MGKPKIGLSMLYCLGESFNKMTELLVNVATDNIELVDDGFHALDKKRVTILRDIGDSYDLKYSVHAPFADVNIASPSKPMLRAALKRLEKSIILANALNAQIWVFHPGIKTGISMFYPGMDWLQNCKSARLLHKIAEDHGLRIAIENVPEPYPFVMKGVEGFAKFYEEVSEDIGLALDVGHAHLNGQMELFFKTFSDKIVHMHVSDNAGESDQHLGIGYGKIYWQKFAERVKEISYDKTIIIESVEHVEESLQKLRQLFS